MEAASFVVALVVGIVELVGVEDLSGDVVVGCEGQSGDEFSAREGRGVGDDGLHVGADGEVRGVGEIGGVGSAGVRDQNTAEVLQRGVEFGGFGG